MLLAGKNGNPFTSGDGLPVWWDDNVAVRLRRGGDVPGALPGQLLDFCSRQVAGEQSGKKTRQSSPGLDGRLQPGMQESKFAGAGSAQGIECRAYK